VNIGERRRVSPESTMRRHPRLLTCIALWTLLATASPTLVAAQDATRQAALILRVLAYDRNLRSRVRDRVTILVVYRQGDSSSERERSQIVRALNAVGARTTVADMRARASDHAYQNAADLTRRARSAHAAAIYVCTGLESQISHIARAARETETLSMTGSEAAVRRGLGVAFVARGSQVRLHVNLPAVQAEGVRLDAAVLRLANVIR
jgi:hypothetical protein